MEKVVDGFEHNLSAMKNVLYLILACVVLQLSSCASHVYVRRPAVGVYVGPPAWAPSYAYRSSLRYYYVPEANLYYDTFTGAYLYNDGLMWRRSMHLPAMYVGFNFSRAYVTQVNYRGTTPYRDNMRHQRQYVSRARSYNNSGSVNAPRQNRSVYQGVSGRTQQGRDTQIRRQNPSVNGNSNPGRRVEPARVPSRVNSGPSRNPSIHSTPRSIQRGSSTPNSRSPQIRSAPSGSRSMPARNGGSMRSAPSSGRGVSRR
ncbi:MAG: hypothetical protein ACK4ND_11605 [Cytophagaceae bacterium]